tara:strand:- start:599 stop:877 length:279 start_codon:yes stop_codon:yes gene_type:complete
VKNKIVKTFLLSLNLIANPIINIVINTSELLSKGIDGKIELLFSGINKIRKKNDISKYLELISFFTTKIIIMKNKKIILKNSTYSLLFTNDY